MTRSGSTFSISRPIASFADRSRTLDVSDQLRLLRPFAAAIRREVRKRISRLFRCALAVLRIHARQSDLEKACASFSSLSSFTEEFRIHLPALVPVSRIAKRTIR